MHIPLFGTNLAKIRWNGGAPELSTAKDLHQAQKDAPYWAGQLRAGNMSAFDVVDKKGITHRASKEAYYLGTFHLLTLVHDATFWNELVKYIGPETHTFWLPILESAVEYGNVHALDALKNHTNQPLQTLFFEWKAFTRNTSKFAPHPASLQWFAEDSSLHGKLREHVQSSLVRDYCREILAYTPPLWWDAPSQTSGAQSIAERTAAWCAMPEHLRNIEGSFNTALYMLNCLNEMDATVPSLDPPNYPEHSSKELENALQQSIEMVCNVAKMPLELLRTLAGRMTPQDLEHPFLCAVAQHEYEYYQVDANRSSRNMNRIPLSIAQRQQVAHNVARAEPLPTLLDMQCQKRTPWLVYQVAEPFISRRPVQTMDLPDGLLDTNVFDPS